ncbi:ATP-dependent helicase [Burkholderia sp. Bp8989]|uniref:UvrD-helicase domain-containing protein n=1 Tax=Burkholderia sp. Bp8989 TaxID=2184551 RepID=UPI000F594065|nr:ATP-dependent helicase [Burkholderia sp. Bp8989]RQS48542.1 ATP-dependent helicase [Burkholderia sp. Bp8989]
MFAWTDHELNEEQTAAVLLPGSVFLVACPGSGKTRTLTYKIAHELENLTTDRQFVIAITYTNRAADEIVSRIEDLGVDTSQLWIGTIHSFCLEWILKPYSIYSPRLARGFRLIDLHERERLLERLCVPYAGHRVTHFDCEYYVTSAGLQLGCQDARKHPIIRDVLREYFETLRASRQIDFELILWFAHRLLVAHPTISRTLSRVFSLILVDEYQDTKQIQYEIIGSILRAGSGQTKLFMVGDPNQAIYGSLGGYPITLDELREITQLHIADRVLSRNYRSSGRIIEYFEHFNVHGTLIEAFGEDRNYRSLITYNHTVSKENLVAEIARLIRHSIQVVGVRACEICVLAPQWIHLAVLTRRLVTEVPEYAFDGPGMVPFSRDIENFWYTVAGLALTEPAPSMYLRRMRWAQDILTALSDVGITLHRIDRKSLLRHCNAIQIVETDGLEYLRMFFALLFERLGVDYRVHQQLEEHHTAFFASSLARIERLEREGVRDSRDIMFFRRVFQDRSGITVSTIHGVKGAEFDVVIACALLEGMVPHFGDPEGATSARKLLYVTGSRARKNLHLISETGRQRGGRRGEYTPTIVLENYEFDYDEN